MKRIIHIIVFLLFLNIATSIEIKEIMYNPEGSDDNYEWFEIYNNEDCINITNLKFYENDINHKINSVENETLCKGEYAIIVDDISSFKERHNYTGKLYESSFSLKNSGENISLKNTTDFLFSVYYNDVANEGNSICDIGNKWEECKPTPGNVNEIFKQDINCLRINEFLPNPYGDDNEEMPEGEWIEIKNECSEEYDLKGFKLKDYYGKDYDLTISDTNTIDGTIIDDYLVIYMNGRSGFLNNENFEEISFYDLDGNLIDKVSYSGSYESLSWNKVDNKWALRKPTPSKKNIESEMDFDSKLNIENVYLGNDNKAKFGDTLRVRVNIIKGNTSRYAVYLYLEKDGIKYSKRTSINIFERYEEFTFTLPLQINPDCNEKYEDGNYYVVLEGLGEKTSEEILIDGYIDDFCQKVNKEKIIKEECISQKENNFDDITGKVIYESSDIKSEEIGLYMFSFLLLILLLSLLIKKWQ